MSNMAYCRFRNTLDAMRDCVEALEENGYDSLSPEEKRACDSLFYNCRELLLLSPRAVDRDKII